jgi:tripartite-type tricarboxylate transporter receptor subunit TctC
MQKLAAVVTTAGAMLGLCMSGFAQAQENWPTRPIEMIVASSAGSGTDALARVMAQRLSETLKQSVIVSDRPGGSGLIGANFVLNAPADGYTILYTTASSAVVAPATLKSFPYDPARKFIPVAQTATGGVILSVNAGLPVHNLNELIAFVKANPDKYSYGTWGAGSSGQLIMEWLKTKTGIKTAHVPYRTATQLLTELSSGDLKFGWTDPAAAAPFIRSGKIRGIAVNGPDRSPQFPQVQTMTEQGYKFDTVGWFGIFVAAGTDPAIVKRLSDEVNKAQTTVQMAELMKNMNLLTPPVKTSAEFGAIVDNDLKVWKKIADDAGIKLDN